MNNIIHKVEISNFRSIRRQIIEFKNINIISGSNDTGKTNVLRALNLFFNNKTEFLESLKFENDFNKLALEKARKSTKGKQLIRIRVYFQKPKTYTIFSKDEEIYAEKIIDRYGTITTSTSHDTQVKKKEQISKMLSQISYVYIPALKGKNVIDYVLTLLSSYDLLTELDIRSLNEKISQNTTDLNELMKETNFTFSANLGLPTQMSDFWQKLAVDTTDQKSNINIPLDFHGEGIKSKFIPNLLMWIVRHNPSKKYHIWGIDEPENSLEFKQAFELSKYYFHSVARSVQLILTTHSLSFIYPSTRLSLNVYRAIQDQEGTKYGKLDANDKDLHEDLGYLLLQQRLANSLHEELEELNRKKSLSEIKLNELDHLIRQAQRPIVITEGITDWMHMKHAFMKLGLNSGFDFLEYTDDLGDSNLFKIIEGQQSTPRQNKIICIFDRDNKKYIDLLHVSDKRYKKFSDQVFGFCIPIPPHRSRYKNISIELFYTDEDLSKKINGRRLLFDNEVTKIVSELCAKNGSKIEFRITNPNTELELEKKIWDTDVDKIVNEKNEKVGISKKRFADQVLNGVGEFSEIHFEEFRLIHDIIVEIIRNG